MTEGCVLKVSDIEIQIKKNDVLLPPGKSYHVYFSYRDTELDRDWVRKVVLSLEKDHGFICCEFSRDFVHGRSIIENINKCVSQSVKTVLVLSKEYLKSDWCKYEAEVLLNMRIHSTEEILIPVIIDDVGYCDIPEHLRNIVYMDCRNIKEIWFSKLLAAIKRCKDPDAVDQNTNRRIFLDSCQNYSNLTLVHTEEAKDVDTTTCACRTGLKFTRKYLPVELDMKGVALDLHTYNKIRLELLQQHFSNIWINGFMFKSGRCCCYFLWAILITCMFFGFQSEHQSIGIVALSLFCVLLTLFIAVAIIYCKQSQKVFTEKKLNGKRLTKVKDIHDPTAKIRIGDENLREKAEYLLLLTSIRYIEDFRNNKLDNGTGKRHCKRAICLCEYLEQNGLI